MFFRPPEMIPVIRKMKEYAEVPLLAKPNAGLPVLQDGVTVYPMLPEEFASWGPEFIEAGAGLIGGCCGTTPEQEDRHSALQEVGLPHILSFYG